MFELSDIYGWVCDNIYPHLHWIQSRSAGIFTVAAFFAEILPLLQPEICGILEYNRDIMHFFCYRSWVKRFFKHELYSAMRLRHRGSSRGERKLPCKFFNSSRGRWQWHRKEEKRKNFVLFSFFFLHLATIKMWKFLFMHF